MRLVYFPYIFYRGGPIKFGSLVLWNFDAEKEVRIPNQSLREYVGKLLAANVGHGRSLHGMAILSRDKPRFSMREVKRNDAQELRTLLFLCGVAKCNIFEGENVGHRMLTADNLTLMFQGFKPDYPWMAQTTGGIISVSDMGHKVGETKYEKPPYILQNTFNMDDELFGALQRIKDSDNLMYSRILRASEAFMGSYYNSTDVRFESRLLHQARAFEMLFDLPDTDQRKVFKKKVHYYCAELSRRKFRSLVYQSKGVKGARSDRGTIFAIWADHFYLLRNDLIHGGEVSIKDFRFRKQGHFNLALLVFLLSIKRIINEVLKEKIFYDEISWSRGKFTYETGSLWRAVERAKQAAFLAQ